MYSEDELLPLSGLPHMAFCDRRWALIHIENVWEDNRFTAEGNLLHEKAHSGEIESRPGVLVRRTLPIHSFRLGLSGQADIVEFHPVLASETGVRFQDRKGNWKPFPIEYKRTRDKAGSMAYRIQLCAQAICLEEMLATSISEGAIYDGTAKRRQTVTFSQELRDSVERLAGEMHRLFRAGHTPSPVFKKACNSCSLKGLCLPEKLSQQASVGSYYERFLRENFD